MFGELVEEGSQFDGPREGALGLLKELESEVDERESPVGPIETVKVEIPILDGPLAESLVVNIIEGVDLAEDSSSGGSYT